MSKEINLTSQKWSDIVFEGKPKDYGAYEMRQTSSRRHIIAFFITVLVVVFVALLPTLIEEVAKLRPAPENISTDTTLADLQAQEQQKQDEIAKQALEEPPPPLKSTIQFVAPVIVEDEEILDDERLKTQEELQDSKLQISIADVKGDDDITGIDIADLKVHQTVADDVDDKVYDFVQQMPEFPGGTTELMKYLRNNVKYPVIAAENGIQGIVTVRFTVMQDGSIGNISILSSPDRTLSEEATRVVKSMPKWIAGKQNGRAVKVNFNLPVHFKLQEQ